MLLSLPPNFHVSVLTKALTTYIRQLDFGCHFHRQPSNATEIVGKKSCYAEMNNRVIKRGGVEPNQRAERGRDVPFVWGAPCVPCYKRKYWTVHSVKKVASSTQPE